MTSFAGTSRNASQYIGGLAFNASPALTNSGYILCGVVNEEMSLCPVRPTDVQRPFHG